jgi:hypothetical protein
VNDGRRRKRFAGLCRTVSDGYVGDEGYDDELQTDEGTGRRADDYVEIFPSGQCGHTVARQR